MSEVIAIAVGKGGVGKTATTVNLAVAMAQDGHKVLVIDLDNQANSTMFLTGHRLKEDVFKRKGIYEVSKMLGVKAVAEYIIPSTINGIDLIPSNMSTPRLEEQVKLWALDNDKEPIEFIFELLGEVFEEREYDFVLIDTPPSQSSLAVQMSIFASTRIIIPVKLEDQSIESLILTDELRKRINKQYDLDVELLGVLPTIVEKTALTAYFLETAFKEKDKEENPNYFDALPEQFGDKLFDTYIRKGNIINESAFEMRPAILVNKKANPSKDYLNLWKEIQQRLPSDEE